MKRLVAIVACLTACESSGSGDGSDLGLATASGSSAKGKSAFAEDVAKQITGETAASAAAPSGSAATQPGAASTGSGSAKLAGGSASAAVATPAAKGSAGTGTGSAVASTGSAKPPTPTPTPPANVKRSAMAQLKLPPQPAAELAKIKLTLGPNWRRDAEGQGTISFALTEPTKGQVVVFVFEYGYELESAPVNRDEYKKWLVDNKVLTNLVDRQRGVSWYIEGTDAGGKAAFRYVAQFGPKKLICGGSLYRDADSNRLGDLRDEIVLRAKQICETVTL